MKNRIILSSLIVVAIVTTVLIIPTFSAQICSVRETKEVVRKALYDYLPNPEASKLNATEIKDILDFYLKSQNLTEVKCDIRATLSLKSYDNIIDEFVTSLVNIKIPTCKDGTQYGKCSTTKPLYCFAGQLVNRCRLCGCLSRQECKIDEKAEFTINEGRWGKCATATKAISITPIFTDYTANKTTITLEDIDGDGIKETLTKVPLEGWGYNITGDIVIVSYEGLETGGFGILRYYDISANTLVDTGIADVCMGSTYIASSNNIIAFTNRTGTLKYYDASANTLTDTGIATDRDGGGTHLDTFNNIVVFVQNAALKYYDTSTNTLFDIGISGVSSRSFLKISNNIIAFYKNDTLMYYDINTGALTEVLAYDRMVYLWGEMDISNNIIAFIDNNLKFEYYDINTDKLINTEITAPAHYSISFSTPMSISDNIISFASSRDVLTYYDTDRKIVFNKTFAPYYEPEPSFSNGVTVYKDGDYLAYFALSSYKQKEPHNIKCEFEGCSERKPHYCEEGLLIDKCGVCNCPLNYSCAVNGNCIFGKIACFNNSACGTSNYTGNYFCKDGDVYKNYLNFSCANPRTVNASCTNSTIPILIDDCGEEEYCINGTSICQLNLTCGDNTLNANCSLTKPFYCQNGTLINDCQKCGCFSDYTCLQNRNCSLLICNDGTAYKNCSLTKPLYCSNGLLQNNCTACGCLTNQTCRADSSCEIQKTITSLSNGLVEANLTFNETTKNQTVYIEVLPEVNVINASLDVTITNITIDTIINKTNVNLDVGTDGIVEATFNDTNATQTTPDLSSEINDYVINNGNQTPTTETISEASEIENQTPVLVGEAIYTESGEILVPLTFYADNSETVKISNIAITYLVQPTAVEEQKLSFWKSILEFIGKLFDW